jgi:hypothetical protein
MPRQLELLEKPARKKPRVLMHVCDAGHCEDGVNVQMECRTCGYQSGWMTCDTVSEAKRGLPCPKCNPESRP